jgi:cytochrome c-type protein NapC
MRVRRTDFVLTQKAPRRWMFVASGATVVIRMNLARLIDAPAGAAAVVLSLIAAALVIGFLVRSPELTPGRKLLLGLALFVLPTMAAMLGNVHNIETTKTVEFCGSCHVMTSYVEDVKSADSRSLASLHARLPVFEGEACYICHADYGMFGGVTTKIGGLHHVVDFHSNDWSTPGHRPPALYKPYDMSRCLRCHDPLRAGAPLEHRVHAQKLQDRTISCSATGCHGPPHPPWKQQVVQ